MPVHEQFIIEPFLAGFSGATKLRTSLFFRTGERKSTGTIANNNKKRKRS